MDRLRRAFAGLTVAAGVACAASEGPRVERVIVEKIDGTARMMPAPAPRPLKARAIPGPEELARLKRARAARSVPSATVEPAPPAPPPVLGAPVAPRTTPVTLTARDRESLRWLRRLRAKFPDRFDRMMVDNPRARWLIEEESQLTDEERAQLHAGQDQDDE